MRLLPIEGRRDDGAPVFFLVHRSPASQSCLKMPHLRDDASPPQYCAPTATGAGVDRRPQRTSAKLASFGSARPAVLGPRRGAGGASRRAAVDLVSAPPDGNGPHATMRSMDAARLRTLQNVGMFCGLTAGAWLWGGEAPDQVGTPRPSPGG